MYSAIVDLAATVAGLGVGNSGVRQIAEASGQGDAAKIAATVRAIRRLTITLGVAGGIVLAALALSASKLTFGTDLHATAIAILGAAVFLRCAGAGEAALLQGLRRIPELAWTSVVGAAVATLGTIGLVWWGGEAGIAAAIVLSAGAGLAATAWFSARVPLTAIGTSPGETRLLYHGLLALGAVFMVGALGQHAGAYIVRTAIFRTLGADAAGLYHAAWTIGSLYIGMVVGAMGADFYPRLVAAYSNPKRCTDVVNEQVRASLLLAGPGVLVTLTFSSVALTVLYSPEFSAASETLRWICGGMALRIVTWPLGFIVVASGRKLTLLWIELAWTAFYISCSLVLTRSFGLAGAGLGFALSYLLHFALVFPIARMLTGFAWDRENRRLIRLYLLSIALVMTALSFFGPRTGLVVGTVVCLGSVVFAARQAFALIDSEALPSSVRRIVAVFSGRAVHKRD
jgi:PST family polysaccharide transporter